MMTTFPLTNVTSLLLDFWTECIGQEGINDERFASLGVLLNNEDMKENRAGMCWNWWAEPHAPFWKAGGNAIYWSDECSPSALLPPVPYTCQNTRTHMPGKKVCNLCLFIFFKLLLYHPHPVRDMNECLPFANFHKSAKLDAQAELKRQNLMFWILVETWLYLCVEKLGWKWEKTSRLCLGTLFRSSHAKFLKSGDAAVLNMWRLPQTPWSKSTYFLTLPLGQNPCTTHWSVIQYHLFYIFFSENNLC